MLLKQRLVQAVIIVAVSFVLVAPVLDRFIFPEPDLPARAYPTVGQVFHSEAEGLSSGSPRSTMSTFGPNSRFIRTRRAHPPTSTRRSPNGSLLPKAKCRYSSMARPRCCGPEKNSSWNLEWPTGRSTRREPRPSFSGLRHLPMACPVTSVCFLPKPTVSSTIHRPMVVRRVRCSRCRVSVRGTTHGSLARPCSCSEDCFGSWVQSPVCWAIGPTMSASRPRANPSGCPGECVGE